MSIAMQPGEKPTQLQRRFLLAQLEQVKRRYGHIERVGAKMPSAVRRAKQIVKRWDQKIRRAQERSYAAHQDRVRRLEEEILFMDAKSALKAVKKFLSDYAKGRG